MTTDEEGARADLRSRYARFETKEAPPMPASFGRGGLLEEALDDAWAEVLVYSADVAGVVTRILCGSAVPPDLLPMLEDEPLVRSRLENLIETAPRQLASDATELLLYLDDVRELAARARRSARTGPDETVK